MTEQAKRIEAQVAAAALGTELMQPMPPGWYRSAFEVAGVRGWLVSAIEREQYNALPWPKRMDYEAKAEALTLTEAHRLCREQAWAKHRKNEEGR